jgi:hypothetical protein
MPTVIARHKVGDFDTWIKGHQDRVEVFGQVTSGFKTFRDTDDPNSILLVLEVTDMDKFATMMKDSRFAPLKEKHTVIEPIVVSTEVEV